MFYYIFLPIYIQHSVVFAAKTYYILYKNLPINFMQSMYTNKKLEKNDFGLVFLFYMYFFNRIFHL